MRRLNTPIDTKGPVKEFKLVMNMPSIPRMIFSGIFGSGKTTFLRNFFKEHEKEFFAIHLFPTNYVSNQNEDIFELIKHDVFYELLKEKPYLEKVRISYLDSIPLTLDTLSIKTFTQFIELIPKIGKSAAAMIEPLYELHKAIVEKQIAVSNSGDEGKMIENFAERIYNMTGHAYEYDLHTQLIKKLVGNTKTKIENYVPTDIEEQLGIIEKQREAVLIVDDLDRIDPDNIFRLLNIFSAHFDLKGEENENKFGFDKIIFCCDIDNIRKIFAHRFGVDVDFNGYIDKFHTELYHFDNSAAVRQIVEDVVRSVYLPMGKLWKRGKGNSDDAGIEVTVNILEAMIESGTFNLRKLINLNGAMVIERNYSLNIPASQYERPHLQLFFIFDFLIKLLGSYEALLSAFRKTMFPLQMKDYVRELLIAESVILIEHKKNQWKIASQLEYSKGPKFFYNIIPYSRGNRGAIAGKIVDYRSQQFELNLNNFLSEALVTYSQIRGPIENR